MLRMDKSIVTIQEVRKLFLQVIESLTIEQINKVPQGFNNNIIWNFGHAISSQQNLCYKPAGLQFKIDEAVVLKFAKGTKPETFIDKAEVDFLKHQSAALIDQLIVDMNNNIFKNYKSLTTGFNVELTNVDDAVKYITMHDGLHFGYAMAIRRLIK